MPTLRTPYLPILLGLLITTATLVAIFHESAPYGPGPSVAEVEQRGIFSYTSTNPEFFCGPFLRGQVKTCKSGAVDRPNLSITLQYTKDGWFKTIKASGYFAYQQNNMRTDEGLKVKADMGFGEDTKESTHVSFHCTKITADTQHLQYGCGYQEIEKNDRGHVKKKITAKIDLHYDQPRGKFTLIRQDTDGKKQHMLRYFDQQHRLRYEKNSADVSDHPVHVKNHFAYTTNLAGIDVMIKATAIHKNEQGWFSRQWQSARHYFLEDEPGPKKTINYHHDVFVTQTKDAHGNPTNVLPLVRNTAHEIYYEYWPD